MGEALAGDGRPDEALAIYKKALSIREKLAAADPASVQARRDLLDSLTALARFTAAMHPAEARDYESRARALEKTVDMNYRLP
jgi:tetratricopeptide (TPR) repeat protein